MRPEVRRMSRHTLHDSGLMQMTSPLINLVGIDWDGLRLLVSRRDRVMGAMVVMT
jgi:hypothetical protein